MFAVQTIKSQSVSPFFFPKCFSPHSLASYCRESLLSKTSPLIFVVERSPPSSSPLSTDSSSLCPAIITCCTARVAPSDDKDCRLSTFMFTGAVMVTTAPAEAQEQHFSTFLPFCVYTTELVSNQR